MLLLLAKRFVYRYICRRDFARYMKIRALAVRIVASLELYERQHLRFIRRFVRPGQTVIDVGANLGAYTICLARAVGPTGKVLAFEPLTDVFRLLQENTASLGNVRYFNLALSSRADTAEIRLPYLLKNLPEPSNATLNPTAGACLRRAVKTAPLDDFLDEMMELSFVKVDIEGHEADFLSGARKVIETHRPLIQFEAMDMASRFADYQSIAEGLGYDLCRLDRALALQVMRSPTAVRGYNFYLSPSEALSENRGSERRTFASADRPPLQP